MFRIAVFLTATGQFVYFAVRLALSQHYQLDHATEIWAVVFAAVGLGHAVYHQVTEHKREQDQ